MSTLHAISNSYAFLWLVFSSEIRDAFLTNVCILYNLKQVAEKLMTMHEECLEGNYQSIEKLREAGSRPAVHHIRQVILVTSTSLNNFLLRP